MPGKQLLIPRFGKAVVVTDGCWRWLKYINQWGYGAFKVGRRTVQAHRFMYELMVGPIPPGLHIDHLCRNHSCLNPDHLEAVTKRENTLRGFSNAAMNARKTHCVRGHEFTPENIWRQPDRPRSRFCVACRKSQYLRSLERARRRAEG